MCSDIAIVWIETIETRLVVGGLHFWKVSATLDSLHICLTSLLSVVVEIFNRLFNCL